MPSFSVPWHYRVAALHGAAGHSWCKLSSGTPLVVAWQKRWFFFFLRLTLCLIGWLCYRGWLTVAIVLLLWQGGEERKETERRKEMRRGGDRIEGKGENRRDKERGEEREQGKKDKRRGRAEDRRGEENRRKRRGKRIRRRGEKRRGNIIWFRCTTHNAGIVPIQHEFHQFHPPNQQSRLQSSSSGKDWQTATVTD